MYSNNKSATARASLRGNPNTNLSSGRLAEAFFVAFVAFARDGVFAVRRDATESDFVAAARGVDERREAREFDLDGVLRTLMRAAVTRSEVAVVT